MRCLLLLILLLNLGAATSGARISVSITDMPAGTALATLSELGDNQFQPDAASLGPGEMARQLSIELVQASPEQTATALAHALGAWWLPESGRSFILTRSPAVPNPGTLSTKAYSSKFIKQPEIEATVQAALAPWLGGKRGLAYHAESGRWYATLDESGHERLRQVLTLLERPNASVPPGIPNAADPLPTERLDQSVEATSWPELLEKLAHASGRSVSISATLAAQPLGAPIHLAPQALTTLPIALQQADVQARWLAGVLCLDDKAISAAEHPALDWYPALIPLGHLGDNLTNQTLTVRLESRIDAQVWQRPGTSITYLAEYGMLFASGRNQTIQTLVNHIDALDRSGVSDE